MLATTVRAKKYVKECDLVAVKVIFACQAPAALLLKG